VQEQTRKTALITGGSGDIGRAIAAKLAEMGYALALAGRDAERLASVRLGLSGFGVDVEPFLFDITDEAAVRQLIASVVGRFGRIDVLVNAAGIGKKDFVARTRPETWLALLSTNAIGVAIVCREVLAVMKRAGRGEIINIGSTAGRRGVAGLAAYSASKAAMMALSDSLREEAERSGIRVFVVAPDRVATRMQGEGVVDGMLLPSDVAEAVAFLLRLSPAAQLPELSLFSRRA
jgi:3-oxoacyl-[acyl-carrier protein] reductase